MDKRSKDAATVASRQQPADTRPKSERKTKRTKQSANEGDVVATEPSMALAPASAPPPAAAAAAPGAAQAPLEPESGSGNNTNSKPSGKTAPVLPWMRVPVAIEASEGIPLEEVAGMAPALQAALHASGVSVLFPVQTVAWHETAGGTSAAHDVCICAPTGSGKTLAYSLPVLQARGELWAAQPVFFWPYRSKATVASR